MSRAKSVPSYRLHKSSGQAVVTLPDGRGGRRDVLLGEHGTPASRAEYGRVIAEWEAAGRQLQVQKSQSQVRLTIAELLLRYFQWADVYYVDPDGQPSRELDNLKDALRPLRQLYAHSEASTFGPLSLRALQDHLIAQDLARGVVNSRINRIRRVFKWAVSFDLIPPVVHHALMTVPGIRQGRGNVRDTEPVRPVALEDVEQALPFMPPPVRAMVNVQLLTGCRAGEVMNMRAIDINTTGAVWVYRPARHKTRHRGKERVVFLGPQAQEHIKPFLRPQLEGYLFNPRAWVEELRAQRAAKRVSKPTPSQLRRKRKTNPKRKPAEKYNRRSYRHAVVRACKKADVTPWSPLQLRHTAGTAIRAKFGVEAAKVILGHSKVETTQIYAEHDFARAEEIMREIG
jgi:integrase